VFDTFWMAQSVPCRMFIPPSFGGWLLELSIRFQVIGRVPFRRGPGIMVDLEPERLAEAIDDLTTLMESVSTP